MELHNNIHREHIDALDAKTKKLEKDIKAEAKRPRETGAANAPQRSVSDNIELSPMGMKASVIGRFAHLVKEMDLNINQSSIDQAKNKIAQGSYNAVEILEVISSKLLAL